MMNDSKDSNQFMFKDKESDHSAETNKKCLIFNDSNSLNISINDVDKSKLIFYFTNLSGQFKNIIENFDRNFH